MTRLTFSKVERGESMLHICRMMDDNGSLVTSLILQTASEGEEAIKWFNGMMERYGESIQL